MLERNYRFKMMYSPDYTEQDSEAVRTNPGRSLLDPELPHLFQVAMLLRYIRITLHCLWLWAACEEQQHVGTLLFARIGYHSTSVTHV